MSNTGSLGLWSRWSRVRVPSLTLRLLAYPVSPAPRRGTSKRRGQKSRLSTALRYASLKVGNWATVSRSTSIGVAVLTARTAW